MNRTKPSTVLVLGAYGLIGAGVCRHLSAQGYRVMGLGRSARTARTVLPYLNWTFADLRDLQTKDAWTPLLGGVDYVVNCAGTLQDGARDSTDRVQHRAIAALAEACAASGIGIIQISAVGAHASAPTAFMRTKAQGDEAVRRTDTSWWIIRPGLVLAPNAYGGTALIRMLAGVPVVQPLALAESPIQTVALDDLGHAVEHCIEGRIPAGTQTDLVADETYTLADIIAAHRKWLGVPPATYVWHAPKAAARVASAVADALGRLGWRSALRSTAVRTLEEGVVGDSKAWQAAGGRSPKSLAETLAGMAATAEHRLAARMALLFPLIIATLFALWLVSSLIGLMRLDQAASVLETVGWPTGLAKASVILWSLVDIALAVALLARRWAAQACLAMVAVSLLYLVASTLVVPALWLDPLGPLVKIGPAIMLALVARALLDAR